MIFIETSTFSRQLEKLRGDHLIDAENYRDLQNALLEESTRIDRIRGTGGLQRHVGKRFMAARAEVFA